MKRKKTIKFDVSLSYQFNEYTMTTDSMLLNQTCPASNNGLLSYVLFVIFSESFETTSKSMTHHLRSFIKRKKLSTYQMLHQLFVV